MEKARVPADFSGVDIARSLNVAPAPASPSIYRAYVKIRFTRVTVAPGVAIAMNLPGPNRMAFGHGTSTPHGLCKTCATS